MIIFSGITHIIISLLLYYSLFPLDLTNITAIVLGSLFPDIDTPYSLLGRFNVFSSIMTHRGITHTFIGMLLCTWLINSTFSHLTSGFVFGYMIHLLSDGLTPMGIRWLYPLRKEHYSIWRTKKKPS